MQLEYGGYFVGWGTLSLINAGLAQSERRAVWFGGLSHSSSDRWQRFCW